jgi:glycine dehydrogenase
MNILEHPDQFINRHIGPGSEETRQMLEFMNLKSLDILIDETIPADIRLNKKIHLEEGLTEYRFLEKLKKIAKRNKVFKSYIGMGYYNTFTPAVIQRNILENPSWYTQYTPYQAEIAQGRLEALMNFQTMIIDLTALPVANASLLDEGTAAAEAMLMFYHLRKNKNAKKFFVSDDCFPQTIDVLKTRSAPIGIELEIGSSFSVKLNEDYFGLFVQYPSGFGDVVDYRELFKSADEFNIYKVAAADLFSLVLLTPPGEFGADAVVGSSQRFGIPMGYGGPHAAFFATKDEYKRSIPGRIIGASIDAQGKTAFRMALQTREQHIRREKATSNICTAQVLLAIMAAMYAVYHGPKGLKSIAVRINCFARAISEAVTSLGFVQHNKFYFDTLKISVPENGLNNISAADIVSKIKKYSVEKEMNFRYIDGLTIGISLNEPTDFLNLVEIIEVFAKAVNKEYTENELKKNILNCEAENSSFQLNGFDFSRKSDFLTHPVFNSYHSETEMLRYLKYLENKDLSLVHSMIPLGSCTMKLNATTEMIGITWPEFARLHPFAPQNQAEGYKQIFDELEKDLCAITGFSAFSFQPNSGAQGEYSGLMVIREYHRSRGDVNRNVVLIPASAHGTNPASAVMAGMKVIVVDTDKHGNISVEDLKLKAEANKDTLAALMVTYPSTHGVFESKIKEMCRIIHDNGGQVYMDGANMNAQVGLTSPASIGADVCHINLHKTFCIPHGGGGPGMGPIGVTEHLVAFLPCHVMINHNAEGHENGITAVSAAPWGSADILIISYAYIKMMGADGLTAATKYAILNANYIKARLEKTFPVLYSAKNGRVAHELIFDMRSFKDSAHIEVEDIAKRLMDYGYHAPTVSFPVAGTLMVEPTESESKAELDKFCDALLSIREEIREIEEGKADASDNVLKNSPHTLESLIAENWQHSYSREKAAYPLPWTRKNKFWPSVGRINNAYGDRNLICSCNSISEYAEV